MGVRGVLQVLKDGYAAWCPGCEEYHIFDRRWQFNGNFQKPTFTPSMLVGAQTNLRCHSFVTDGEWQFLSDSCHELRGQSAPVVLPDFEEGEA